MKTTLDLPDDLMRSIKIRAAEENRRLKDVVADLLRSGLAAPAEPDVIRNRVKLPLIHTPQRAQPEDFSPERIAAILEAE
jgi:plasmid stability protein